MFPTDGDSTALLTFKELVDATGESERTLRYYLHLGLLEGPSSSGPNARYHRDNVKKVHWIRQRQRDGMGLREIQQELQGGWMPAPSARQPAAAPVAGGQGSLAFLQSHGRAPAAASLPRKGAGQQREVWERTVLDEGIELWVKRPLDPHRQRLLVQLLAKTEQFFNGAKSAPWEEP